MEMAPNPAPRIRRESARIAPCFRPWFRTGSQRVDIANTRFPVAVHAGAGQQRSHSSNWLYLITADRLQSVLSQHHVTSVSSRVAADND